VHSQAVATQAERVGSFLEPAEHEVLVAAAYLHDVGYAPSLVDSGFHPLDGARWLTELGHNRLAGLVAHHSGSKHEAELRGLAGELAAFPEERSLVAAALAYCDLTIGPNGELMTPDERLAEVEVRHGPNSTVAAGLRRAWLELLDAVGLVEERLRTRG
jgi:HD superfamily phosphodiesterase